MNNGVIERGRYRFTERWAQHKEKEERGRGVQRLGLMKDGTLGLITSCKMGGLNDTISMYAGGEEGGGGKCPYARLMAVAVCAACSTRNI